MHPKQAEFDAALKAYTTALYAAPRDEAECLRLAQAVLDLARGTRLEATAVLRVERHARKVSP